MSALHTDTVTAEPVEARTGRGFRHLDCDQYQSCLDHAAHEKWPSFSCTDCPRGARVDLFDIRVGVRLRGRWLSGMAGQTGETDDALALLELKEKLWTQPTAEQAARALPARSTRRSGGQVVALKQPRPERRGWGRGLCCCAPECEVCAAARGLCRRHYVAIADQGTVEAALADLSWSEALRRTRRVFHVDWLDAVWTYFGSWEGAAGSARLSAEKLRDQAFKRGLGLGRETLAGPLDDELLSAWPLAPRAEQEHAGACTAPRCEEHICAVGLCRLHYDALIAMPAAPTPAQHITYPQLLARSRVVAAQVYLPRAIDAAGGMREAAVRRTGLNARRLDALCSRFAVEVPW